MAIRGLSSSETISAKAKSQYRFGGLGSHM
jgi:hypothetical protein